MIAGSKKTVNLFYMSSSGRLVPYVLPLTCSQLNYDICNQSGEGFILYEFSFVAIDQTGNRNDPKVCNVVVHPPTMKIPTQLTSSTRYDLLPTFSFLYKMSSAGGQTDQGLWNESDLTFGLSKFCLE